MGHGNKTEGYWEVSMNLRMICASHSYISQGPQYECTLLGDVMCFDVEWFNRMSWTPILNRCYWLIPWWLTYKKNLSNWNCYTNSPGVQPSQKIQTYIYFNFISLSSDLNEQKNLYHMYMRVGKIINIKFVFAFLITSYF